MRIGAGTLTPYMREGRQDGARRVADRGVGLLRASELSLDAGRRLRRPDVGTVSATRPFFHEHGYAVRCQKMPSARFTLSRYTRSISPVER